MRAMQYFKTQAIVLKKVDYGDSSLILTALARDFGKIALTAKGVKRALSKFEAPPEVFTVQQFVFSRRGSAAMATASESTLMRDFPGLRCDLLRHYAACYLAEIVLNLCPEWEPIEGLYDAALTALAGIDSDDAEMTLLRFEAAMLELLGHAPLLSECCVCGTERKKAATVLLSALCGGYLCDECAASDPAARRILGGTAPAMEALCSTRHKSLHLNKKARLDLLRAFDYLFVFHREKPIRSMTLLEGVLRDEREKP